MWLFDNKLEAIIKGLWTTLGMRNKNNEQISKWKIYNKEQNIKGVPYVGYIIND